MKILIVNYMPGEARFVIGGFPKTTFCISLEGKTTVKQVTDELKATVEAKAVNTAEQTFNDLNLKSLVGTDI